MKMEMRLLALGVLMLVMIVASCQQQAVACVSSPGAAQSTSL